MQGSDYRRGKRRHAIGRQFSRDITATARADKTYTRQIVTYNEYSTEVFDHEPDVLVHST